jgi:hypothetical protein
MRKPIFLSVLLPALSLQLLAQPVHRVSLEVDVAARLRDEFSAEGRLFIFLSENPYGEPRRQLWPISQLKNHIFARNIEGWEPRQTLEVRDDLDRTGPFELEAVPEGSYQVQVLWDQDREESRINAPGNLYSKVQPVAIKEDMVLEIRLDEKIPPRALVEHDFVKGIEWQSDTLSSWWKRPVKLKAAVLLPVDYYEHPDKRYPVRFNIAGYGGRYIRVNWMVQENSSFSKWWFSEQAPRIINVFLDGEGPFGDSYQLDSENNGPYGHALIYELIPHIESSYRAIGTPASRFVDGCSTGGWVALALQVFYPDFFNGAFAYSPDAVEFENYQTINIYKDRNAFFNEWGNPRPAARDLTGDPMVTMEEFIRYENVQGTSGTYLNSGGQISAHTALYSPKGKNGLPAPLFNHLTGEIDRKVAEHWKKYDLKIHLMDNWTEIGPKIQGKIWIWMGDMDHYLLNPATRALDAYLKSTKDPESDAEIIFEPMQGHCSRFSHREILEMIAEKLKNESN